MYVDDKNNCMGIIPYGHRWHEVRVQYNRDWIEEDSKTPADLHTCRVLTDLSNRINPAIQFTGDGIPGATHEIC